MESTGLENVVEHAKTFEIEEQQLNSEQLSTESLASQGGFVQAELVPQLLMATEPNPIDAAQAPLQLELEVETETESLSLSSAPVESHEQWLVANEVFSDSTQGDDTQVTKEFAEAQLPTPLAPPPADHWSDLEPTAFRRRPKEPSSIRKVLPPILGGLAAFPIATLILWYGFGKDIGTTGPTVAKYLPWIVPKKFRNMPFESSSPNFSSGRSQRSSPSARSTLPTLNRDEATEQPNDNSSASIPNIAAKKPTVEPEQPNRPSEPKSNAVSETAGAKISGTLEALKSLQREMENAPDDSKVKMQILVPFQAKLKELSHQVHDLVGPTARMWSIQVEATSRKILANPDIPKALFRMANKARREIAPSVSGDFVATVINIGATNAPSLNEEWTLQEKWESDQAAIPIEVLPGAWRPGSASLPATCLVLGRLLAREDSAPDALDSNSTKAGLVLKVHLLVPR